MFKLIQISLYLVFSWTFFIAYSFASDPSLREQRYQLGFEFQESNHLFNQGDVETPEFLHSELIKTPLFSFYYKGKKIFHIEADDLDLEIVTMPFSSDNKDFFIESFRIIQTFIDKLYEFLAAPGENKKLADLFRMAGESISQGKYFTEEDFAKYGGAPVTGEIKINAQKAEDILNGIKIYKKPNFTPGFKPQFSIQTHLSNFILSYFYLFYANNSRTQTPQMHAIREALSGKKLELRDYNDPIQNFIALYLYTCISPQVVSDRIAMGSGMLGYMVESHQCDYKMYLPLMSRVSFSSLSQRLEGWRAIMDSQWPGKDQFLNIGKHDFGDFYDSKITEKLRAYLDKSIPQADLPLFKRALANGIMTTGILKALDLRAFVSAAEKERIDKYMDEYGRQVFLSIGTPKNSRLQLGLTPRSDSAVITFQTQEVANDLISPPFLSQEENSMGTFDASTLNPTYGNFLFEIRAADKLGSFIKQILKAHGVENPRDFLQVPCNIGRDAQSFMTALDLIYTRRSEPTYANLITKIGEFTHE